MLASSEGRIKLPEYFSNGRWYKTEPRIGSMSRSSAKASHTYRVLTTRKYGTHKVHRLICEAFHGPPPFDGAVVIHKDENALNNKEENLMWGTQKENLNMPNFLEHCRQRTGDANPRVKGIKRKCNY
jgi:hypothetical protein